MTLLIRPVHEINYENTLRRAIEFVSKLNVQNTILKLIKSDNNISFENIVYGLDIYTVFYRLF